MSESARCEVCDALSTCWDGEQYCCNDCVLPGQIGALSPYDVRPTKAAIHELLRQRGIFRERCKALAGMIARGEDG